MRLPVARSAVARHLAIAPLTPLASFGTIAGLRGALPLAAVILLVTWRAGPLIDALTKGPPLAAIIAKPRIEAAIAAEDGLLATGQTVTLFATFTPGRIGPLTSARTDLRMEPAHTANSTHQFPWFTRLKAVGNGVMLGSGEGVAGVVGAGIVIVKLNG